MFLINYTDYIYLFSMENIRTRASTIINRFVQEAVTETARNDRSITSWATFTENVFITYWLNISESLKLVRNSCLKRPIINNCILILIPLIILVYTYIFFLLYFFKFKFCLFFFKADMKQ